MTVAGCLCPSVCSPHVSMTGSCGRPPVAAQDSRRLHSGAGISPREKPSHAAQDWRLCCSRCCRGNMMITTCKPQEVSIRVGHSVCVGVVTASPLFCPTSPWIHRAAHVSSPCGGQDAEGLEVSLKRGPAEVPPAPANNRTVSRGDAGPDDQRGQCAPSSDSNLMELTPRPTTCVGHW